MKLRDLFEGASDEAKTLKGTYAGFKYDSDSTQAISDFLKQHNIPNCVGQSSLHTTLLYSRKYCPDYVPAGEIEERVPCSPTSFCVWKTQTGKSALVVKLDCQYMVDRHEYLMDKLGATYDYDDYIPHITLSYDVGDDFDVETLNIKDFPSVSPSNEYGEDLDLEWSPK